MNPVNYHLARICREGNAPETAKPFRSARKDVYFPSASVEMDDTVAQTFFRSVPFPFSLPGSGDGRAGERAGFT